MICLIGRKELVPFAFQLLLARTADTSPDFVADGKYGAGIANADALLEMTLPSVEEVERFRDVIFAQPVGDLSVVSGLWTGLFGLDERATVALTLDATKDDAGNVQAGLPEQTAVVQRARRDEAAARALIVDLLGAQADALASELLARIATDRLLLVGFQRWRHGRRRRPRAGSGPTPSIRAWRRGWRQRRSTRSRSRPVGSTT